MANYRVSTNNNNNNNNNNDDDDNNNNNLNVTHLQLQGMSETPLRRQPIAELHFIVELQTHIISALLSAYFILVSCLAYSSTPKTKGTCSSETSVDFQQTT
jgi:hypothetical protein